MNHSSQRGFTLIEIIVFIVVSSLLLNVLLLSSITSLRNMPSLHAQTVAIQTARQCTEWFLEQSRLNGYTSLTCPSSPTAGLCTAPSGFAVSTSITCLTWNNDSQYKKITVSVTGQANASLSVQVGGY